MTSDSPPDPRHVGGAWIPPYILRHPTLADSAKVLAGRLHGLSTDRGFAFASNAYLSDDLGVSERAVQRRLAALQDAGLVRVEYERHAWGTERRVFFRPPHATEVSGGGRQERRVGGDTSVAQSKESEYRDGVREETSEFQGELLGSSEGNGSNPLEDVVSEVWEHTLAAWKERVGNRPGPDLQPTDSRLSKIRARARELLRAGASPTDAIVYLGVAAQGFYADDWQERDRYLDPGRYLFRDDDTVRRFYRDGRRESLGLSKKDAERASRVAEILKNGS